MTRDEIGERRALEDVTHGAFDAAPQLLKSAVMALRTDILVVRLETEHRGDRPFENLDDLREADLGWIAGKLGAAAHTAMRHHDAVLGQRRQLMFEEPRGDVLTLGDLARG